MLLAELLHTLGLEGESNLDVPQLVVTPYQEDLAWAKNFLREQIRHHLKMFVGYLTGIWYQDVKQLLFSQVFKNSK